MTSYSDMAARGREEARERTMGRRKRRAVRIESKQVPVQQWVPAQPPFASEGFYRDHPTQRQHEHTLVGECGHRLAVQRSYTSAPPGWWAWAIEQGKRITCGHDDCRIPPKPEVPDDERCTYVMGVDFERRCSTRSRYETGMGRACRRHRDWWLREGYIHEDGSLRGD